MAPRVPSDPDAVFQILVPQRSRPRFHVDEPRFPVCLSSHCLPLQHPPLLRDGKNSKGMVRLKLVCSGGNTFFPPKFLTSLSVCHLLDHVSVAVCCQGLPRQDPQTALPAFCLHAVCCCCELGAEASDQEMVALCLETVLNSNRILAKTNWFLF